MAFSEEKGYINAVYNARPIEELTTKTDAFFQALTFSDKYKTVNTQIRAVFLGFLFRVRQKNKSFVLGGFLWLVSF